jgi:hypothetical protein
MTTKDLIVLKEKTATLAKNKGFESLFLFDKPYKYSNKESLRWLFWLTELNQWLMERKLGVTIMPYYNGENLFRPYYRNNTNNTVMFPIYMSYEDGLVTEITKQLNTLPDAN